MKTPKCLLARVNIGESPFFLSFIPKIMDIGQALIEQQNLADLIASFYSEFKKKVLPKRIYLDKRLGLSQTF